MHLVLTSCKTADKGKYDLLYTLYTYIIDIFDIHIDGFISNLTEKKNHSNFQFGITNSCEY